MPSGYRYACYFKNERKDWWKKTKNIITC
jgi:hypothetical protein